MMEEAFIIKWLLNCYSLHTNRWKQSTILNDSEINV